MSTHIPDELLTAYLDGDLDDADRERVEQALSGDARLAQRVARQRQLRAGAPGNRRPLEFIRPAPPASAQGLPTGPAEIIDLARIRTLRSRRAQRRHLPIPQRMLAALAACLLVGATAGLLTGRFIAGARPTQFRDGALLASGPLARALSDQLSSGASGSARAVRVGLSFHGRSGGFCRAFALDGRHPSTGLACHEQDRWRIVTLIGQDATMPLPDVTSRAITLLPTLRQAISDNTSGDALDLSAEARARLEGWD